LRQDSLLLHQQPDGEAGVELTNSDGQNTSPGVPSRYFAVRKRLDERIITMPGGNYTKMTGIPDKDLPIACRGVH
jgi:hypothetical protein